MSAYTYKIGSDLKSLSTQLSTLKVKIDSSKDLLNSYVNSANSSKTKGNYDKYVGKYNSEKLNFDNLITQYTSMGGSYSTKLDKYNKLSFSQKAQIVSYKLPNAKDDNQWKAGGELYNNKYSGGYIFSPTSVPDVDGKPSLDFGYTVTNGDIHGHLNEGFSEVQREIKGGDLLDLMESHKETSIYSVEITVETTNGEVYTHVDYVNNDASLSNINALTQMSTTTSLVSSMINTPSMNLMNLSIVGTIQFLVTNVSNGNVYDSGKFNLANVLASSLYHTTKDVFTQKMTIGLARTFNITNITALGVLNFAVTTLFSEVLEVFVLKIDNYFGFGGEMKGTDQFGNPVYGRAKSFKQGLKELLPESVRDILNIEYTNEDILTALEDSNGTYGLKNSDGDTSTYNYDSFSGDNINIGGKNYNNMLNDVTGGQLHNQSLIDAQKMLDQLSSLDDWSNTTWNGDNSEHDDWDGDGLSDGINDGSDRMNNDEEEG